MVWSTQFFLFRARKWKEWQELAQIRVDAAPMWADRGAIAYADCQISFWTSMAKRADNIFQEVNTSYSSII